MSDALLAALSSVTGTGGFHSFGHSDFFFPRIEIEGLGELAFPLSAAQAKELVALAEAAPYGKGSETVFDEAVRKCWQVDASRFSMRAAPWQKYLAATLSRVAADLGIAGKISAHPYKLLLYGKGGHFKAHRDTEKLDAMFGTLIIALPSAHEGGQLFIRHGGREVEVDFSRDDHRHDFQHAAFFADCEHEVVPVRAGYRCCLVYNLRLDEGDPEALNVALDAHARALAPALRDLKSSRSGALTAVLLEHAYTEANFSLPGLKGHDASRARALLSAAAESGFSAHLALVTRHKMGELDADISYGRRHRGWYEDDIDPDNGKMGEVYEDDITIDHWRDAANRKLALGAYQLDENDLLSRETFGEGEPDEKEAESYTGNAGCTMDYWYRRAAVVLWRAEDQEAIVCRYNLDGACEALTQLAERNKTSAGSPFHRLGTAVTGRLITDLNGAGDYRFRSSNPEDAFSVLLRAIVRTASRDLLDRLLADLTEDAWNVCDDALWRSLHETFGDEAFTALDRRLLEEESGAHRRLLFHRLTALIHREPVHPSAGSIAVRLIRLTPPGRNPGWSARAESLEAARAEIRAILSSGSLIPRANRKAALAFVLADRSLDHVRELLGPVLAESAVASLAGEKATIAADARRFAIDALEQEITVKLSPFPDWMRPYPAEGTPGESTTSRPQFGYRQVNPAAAAFQELRKFMLDAEARQHGFRYRQDIRDALEHFIRSHQLDLDFTTIRTSSPHVLSCAKNDQSYRRKLARRASDEMLLKQIKPL